MIEIIRRTPIINQIPLNVQFIVSNAAQLCRRLFNFWEYVEEPPILPSLELRGRVTGMSEEERREFLLLTTLFIENEDFENPLARLEVVQIMTALLKTPRLLREPLSRIVVPLYIATPTMNPRDIEFIFKQLTDLYPAEREIVITRVRQVIEEEQRTQPWVELIDERTPTIIPWKALLLAEISILPDNRERERLYGSSSPPTVIH